MRCLLFANHETEVIYVTTVCYEPFLLHFHKKKSDILNRALTNRLKSLTMTVLLFSWQTTCWSSSHPSFSLCQTLVNKYYLVIKLSNFLTAKITNIRKKCWAWVRYLICVKYFRLIAELCAVGEMFKINSQVPNTLFFQIYLRDIKYVTINFICCIKTFHLYAQNYRGLHNSP